MPVPDVRKVRGALVTGCRCGCFVMPRRACAVHCRARAGLAGLVPLRWARHAKVEQHVRWEPRQNAPCVSNKVGDQHDASSPNHEGLYMYRYGRRCGRFNTLFVTTRRRACSIQRSDSSSGRSDIASRSTRPQASRVEGGERWKSERFEPVMPPDFYGDATRIGVASRVGSSIVNDQWRWGRTIGVHSASVPATAPRSASARSLAATSSFA